MKYASLAAFVAASSVLAACSLEPDYQRPDAPVAPTWPTGPAYGGASGSASSTPVDAIGWRDFFVDPRLTALIDIALKNNRDLRIAALNVQTAEAQVRGTQSNLLPHINGTAGATYEGIPNDPSGQQVGNYSGVSKYYTAGIGFTSYELDLFGQIRSQTHQALQQYLSSQETQRSTEISLVSQVATAYVTLLGDQDLLALTKQTLDSQTQSYAITKATVAQGTGTDLTLAQAETAVDTAKANLAQYTRQVAQDENALVLLLGQPMPATLPAGRNLSDEAVLTDLPAGIPSDVLTRRPDVLAAEHTLQAANANIGAARAAFFPSISLTASGGLASASLNKLFTGGAVNWTFSPQINIPIFNYGENQANLDIAKVEKNVDIATYEKTIQTAFSEVANGLAGRATYADQIKAETALVAANANSYRLADMRFRSGVDDYLNALDAQRSLYAAQQSLISLKAAQLSNLITLYKALGGGWTATTVKLAGQ